MRICGTMFLALVIFGNTALGGTNAAKKWQLIEDGNYNLPYGTSYSKPFFYSPPLEAKALKIVYSGPNCYAQVKSIDLEYDDMHLLPGTLYPDSIDGIITLKHTGITRMVVHTRQTTFSTVSCREQIFASDVGFSDAEAFEYVGRFEYQGGKQVGEVPVAFKEKVTQIWIERPKFCEKAKIKKVETKTNEHYYQSKALDKSKGLFEVDGTDGARISAIRFELNGPEDLTCEVSVYAKRP